MNYCDYCKNRNTSQCEECIKIEDIYDSDNNNFYEDCDYTHFEPKEKGENI